MEDLLRLEKEQNIRPSPEIDAFMKALSVGGKKHSVSTDYTLKLLGLDVCADTFVGNDMLRGVSGGQRKRVTSGEMIVGPKKTLFMDEISTGLAVVWSCVVYYTVGFAPAAERRSLTEFDPRLVAPACLYLAAKAEESTVQARLLVFYVKKMYPDDIRYRFEIKDILEMEMKILEALNYYLVVFHPYRSLTQFLQDAGMMDLMQFTWGIVNDTYKMDLILVHPPHLIALACIYIASVSKEKDSISWFEELRVDMNVVTRMVVSTYQAASGAGAAAMEELELQTREVCYILFSYLLSHFICACRGNTATYGSPNSYILSPTVGVDICISFFRLDYF